MGKVRKLHFEDNGQDFLWWDINEDNLVVAVGPFQYDIWSGLHVSSIACGTEPIIMVDENPRQLKHKIIKIEELEVTNG